MSRPDDELRTRLDRGAAKPSLGCSDAPMQLGHRRIVDREVIFGLIMMATKGSAIGMPATSVRQADEVGAVRAAPTAASMAVTRTGDDRTAPRRGRNGVEDGPTRLCWSARNANPFAGEESRDAPLRHRRSRLQPSFGQISPLKRPFGALATDWERRKRATFRDQRGT